MGVIRSHAVTSYTTLHVNAEETNVDVANNRSYISTSISIYGPNFRASNINGNVTGCGGFSTSANTYGDWTSLCSGGFWVNHNADGTGSAVVGSYFNTTYGNAMGYGENTIALTTIPRASQPSINTYPNNSPNITAGVACTIHMNKHANFRHTVKYSFGNKTGTIATGVVDNCKWTPPTSLLDQIKTATVGYGKISVETYSGSTKIGDTKTCNFNLHVPSDANPTVGTITLTEQHEGVKAINGNVTVQQISKKLVSVPVTAKYSTGIKSVVCDGVTLTNNNGTYTGYVSNKSNGTYTVTATDNRGLKSTGTVKQTYYAYSKPYVTASLKRESETSQNGTLSASGTYSTILSNTVSMSIKRNDESSATSVTPTLSNGNISFSKAYTDLYYTSSFSITVVITDSFGEKSSTTTYLGIGQYAFAMIKRGVVLGPDSYLFDKQNVMRSVLDFFYPVGSIYVSTSASFNPQEVWGGTWKKTADGRCLIGANSTYPLGSTGGESNHTLTESEMPSHRHAEKIGDQSYPQLTNFLRLMAKNGTNSGAVIEADWKSTGLGNDVMTNYSGGNNPHNNMQPYLAVYIWERIS